MRRMECPVARCGGSGPGPGRPAKPGLAERRGASHAAGVTTEGDEAASVRGRGAPGVATASAWVGASCVCTGPLIDAGSVESIGAARWWSSIARCSAVAVAPAQGRSHAARASTTLPRCIRRMKAVSPTLKAGSTRSDIPGSDVRVGLIS